jgi:hypothetical protein
MSVRQSGIAGLAVILLCVGCRHVQQAASPALPGPALAATPQAGPIETAPYPSSIAPPTVAQPAVYPAPAVDPALSSIFDPSENQTDGNPPGELSSVTDPNAPTWPTPSVAEDYCRPTFGEHFRGDIGILWHQTVCDYKNYYSWKNLGVLAVGFGVGAIGANTELDQHIRNWYQKSVRSNSSDQVAKIAKKFGEGGYEVPAAAAAWLVGETFHDTRCGDVVGEWGDRELRSLIVGTPPMLVMQYVTGASRPGETTAESRWKPFADNNGVSGHAFIGALPFINAAKMTDEVPLKIGFYACSAFAGWSRINDDAHYTSQVFLGWWMAYWAATTVDLTDHQPHDWIITPLPMANGAGMAITYQY